MTRGVDSGDKTSHPTLSVIPCPDCGFRIIGRAALDAAS